MPYNPEVFFSEYCQGHKQADWLDFALVQFKFCTISLISVENEQGKSSPIWQTNLVTILIHKWPNPKSASASTISRP